MTGGIAPLTEGRRAGDIRFLPSQLRPAVMEALSTGCLFGGHARYRQEDVGLGQSYCSGLIRRSFRDHVPSRGVATTFLGAPLLAGCCGVVLGECGADPGGHDAALGLARVGQGMTA